MKWLATRSHLIIDHCSEWENIEHGIDRFPHFLAEYIAEFAETFPRSSHQNVRWGRGTVSANDHATHLKKLNNC